MNRLLIFLAVVLLNLFSALSAQGQGTKTLKGIVLNDAKQPISQVTINIPGSKPVYTDEDGTFSIARVNDSEWLIVTPIEKYQSKRILLTDEEDIVIYVTNNDIVSLYSPVRTPLDNRTGRNMLSSYKTLESSKFKDKPLSSVEQYFQGTVPGAYVTQSSGMPGSAATVNIRGYSSLLSNNQPLYVVDGIPLENSNIYNGLIEGDYTSQVASIDPLDISEITVLKDAAATALYGAKGANGVVIIKTLEPKETKTSIKFLYRTGMSFAPKQLPQLGTKAYKTLANELLFSSGLPEERFKESYPGLFYTPADEEFVRYNHDTNWQDEVFRNSFMQNAHFSIKGGDAIAKYGLSIGFLSSDGVIKNTSYDRVNIRLVGVFDIFSWLKMNIATNLTTSNSFLKESGLSSVTNPILSSLWKSPMLNPYEYDDNGKLLSIVDEVDELGTSNTAAVISLSKTQAKNYRFMTSVGLDGDITKDLKFSSIFGLNSSNTKEFVFIPNRGFDLLYDGEVFNESKAQNNSLYTVYNDNRIYYSKEINRVHSLYGALGFRWQKNEFDIDYGFARNTASDYYTNLNRGTNLLNLIGGNNRAWNWASLYANLSYSFADKYLLSLTSSNDISSIVGDEAINTVQLFNMPVGMFYSAAGAWRISNEQFFPEINGLDELKLRASYGLTGNDDVGELNSFSHFAVSQYRNTSVLVPGNLANNQLSFQTKKEFNIGLDFSAFGNRFNFTANYFNNKSENVMMYELQNSYLGYNTYPNNSAAFSTKGFELEAFARVISNSDFTLDLGVNLSKYNTIIDKISTGQQIVDVPGGLQIINKEGYPINSFYGFKYKGVYATTDDAVAANMSNFRGLSYGAGDAIYENVPNANGDLDNVIDKNDKQILGSFEPELYGGFIVNSRYKNFSLNLLFQGVFGNKVYNFARRENEKMTGLENQSVKTLQRWQYEGQVTQVPKATWNDPMGNADFSDRWIEDGSYLRLKNLTLAYDLKTNIPGITGLKVFVTGSNLVTFSKYLGNDPEFSYSQNMYSQGIDFANTPLSQQVMFGVEIGL